MSQKQRKEAIDILAAGRAKLAADVEASGVTPAASSTDGSGSGVTLAPDPVVTTCSVIDSSIDSFWQSIHQCCTYTIQADTIPFDLEVPNLPTQDFEPQHRCKRTTHMIPHALTVRPLNNKEVNADPAALASIDKEWRRLRDRKAWDQGTVREWADVAGEARRANQDVHIGMLFGFVVEKNPDLPVGDPRRKFKGRVVFQ